MHVPHGRRSVLRAGAAPGFKTTYEPDPERATQYTEGYQRYRALAETVESAPLAPPCALRAGPIDSNELK